MSVSSGAVYRNFVDCHNALQYKLDYHYEDNNSEQIPLHLEDVPYGGSIDLGISVLSYLESKYTCSGICEPGLFYFSLDVTEGIPDQTCLAYAKDEIGSSLSYMGITSMVCGIVCFFIWLCQYALWRRYDDKNVSDCHFTPSIGHRPLGLNTPNIMSDLFQIL